MTKHTLTHRQQEILSLIQSHMADTGSPPTRAEIAKLMGFRSPNAAEDHLKALARKGVIELVPGTSRGIRLTTSTSGIPIIRMDRLSMGQPLLSEQHIESTCRLDRNFFKPSIDFLLQYTQRNNPEFGILENDYLAVHQIREVSKGQIALVRVNQELVLRRFAEDSQSLSHSVEGLVVGVIRSLTKNPLLS